MKKTVSTIWSIFTTLLTIFLILLAMALVGVRMFDYTPYAILSGSMTPTYSVGDLIYVKPAEFSEIKPGDVISFVADEKLTVVTHRVDSVDEAERMFLTKGDANETVDAKPVLYENVIGVVRFSLPKLGYVSSYLTSPTGRYVCAAGVVGVILLLVITELYKYSKRKGMKE